MVTFDAFTPNEQLLASMIMALMLAEIGLAYLVYRVNKKINFVLHYLASGDDE